MNHCRKFTGLLLLVIILPTMAMAQIAAPKAPALAAKGYLLLDFRSGRVLAEQNPNEIGRADRKSVG